MAYGWNLEVQTNESRTARGAEWDEIYSVTGYTQGLGPAWPDLLADQPILAPGQPHPTVANAYVDNFDAQPADDTSLWRATVRYIISTDDEFDLSPLARPAKISVEPESIEVPTLVWADGAPILNTANELIGGVTTIENRWVFTFRKNVSAIPTWLLSYGRAVNSDAVSIKGLGVSPHYLLLRQPRAAEEETETVNGIDVSFVPLSFSWVYNPRTWKTVVLNRGLNEIDGDGKLVPILDEEGEPVSEPWFLDNAGAALPRPLVPANVVTVEGWTYDLKPFSVFPTT